MDRVKHLIGDLAGPFAIWWTSRAAGIAIVRLARPDNHLSGAAVYIGARSLRAWPPSTSTKRGKTPRPAQSWTDPSDNLHRSQHGLSPWCAVARSAHWRSP